MKITTLEQAVELILQQQGQIKQLQEDNQRLKREVERLAAQLRKYHNVNTPSGALPPYLKDELNKITRSVDEKEPPSKQAANRRNRRPECDRVEMHKIEKCPHCGSTDLKQREKTSERIVIHLQLPKVEAVLHKSSSCFCRNCKSEISPEIPNVLPKSKYDMNISILVVLLYVLGTTQSKTREILGWFGVNLCEASVNNIIHRMQKCLGEKKYRELEEELKKSFHSGADETSHRHRGKTFWIWVVATARTVFFRIAESRGGREAKKLPLPKITGCDGYRAYDKASKEMQRCWAHLMRKLRDSSLIFNEQWEVEQFVSFVKEVSALYKQAKNEKRRGNAVKKEYEKKLNEIIQSKYKEEANLVSVLNYILEYFDDWFTFLKYRGIEPTNNRAERALRPLVVQRKVSQHTWSDEGRDGLAIMQSIYQTSKLRGENFSEILRHEVEMNLHERGNF